MSLALMMMATQSPACFAAKKSPSPPPRKTQRQKPASHGFGGEKKTPVWQCVENCGACCKLDKGPTFPSPEEIFDDPSDVEVYFRSLLAQCMHFKNNLEFWGTMVLYNSLVGQDGWCKHYDKSSRKCSIYADRPYFCRVEPEIFDTLYGIDKKRFNKEACSCCADTIKTVYGTNSQELEKFNSAIWSSSSK